MKNSRKKKLCEMPLAINRLSRAPIIGENFIYHKHIFTVPLSLSNIGSQAISYLNRLHVDWAEENDWKQNKCNTVADLR